MKPTSVQLKGDTVTIDFSDHSVIHLPINEAKLLRNMLRRTLETPEFSRAVAKLAATNANADTLEIAPKTITMWRRGLARPLPRFQREVINLANAHLTCEDCGISDDRVITAPCPYAQDIYGDETPRDLCGTCHDARAEDI